MLRYMMILFLAGWATQASCTEAPLAITIDSGGVEVVLVDGPMAAPVELSYRAGGACQPDVTIETSGDVTRAVHSKRCEGEQEGTKFSLRIDARRSFTLKLNAGAVRLPLAGLDNYRQLQLGVGVGAIKPAPGVPELRRERRRLVGAAAVAERANGCCTMDVQLNYGSISFQ